MSQPPLLENPAPSWAVPVLAGALFTILLTMLPWALPRELGVCCCCASVLPAGILPTFLAARGDADLTPGQGFTVSFIACGAGNVLVAIFSVLSLRDVGHAELVRVSREGIEELARASGGPALTPEEIQHHAELAADLLMYVPIVTAAVATLIAGFVGLLTLLVIRRARRRPPPVGTQG